MGSFDSVNYSSRLRFDGSALSFRRAPVAAIDAVPLCIHVGWDNPASAAADGRRFRLLRRRDVY
jgi:hypothetical protein